MNVNFEIAITHVFTRRKQTFVAALGVALGVAVYLFMNSLSSGFTNFSRSEIFKNSAHIKVYKDDMLSQPIIPSMDGNLLVILNPQIITFSKKIINPQELLNRIKAEDYVSNALSQVNLDVFYNRGNSRIAGNTNGVNILSYNEMFQTGKYLAAGSLEALQRNLNGIIIGSGVSEKLSLGVGDNISVTSSYNVNKVMRIVGIIKTGSSLTDNTKSYVNIRTAQQFLKEGPSFVSSILVKTNNADKSEFFSKRLQQITEYKVEDWKTTNSDLLAGDKTRAALMGAISISILVVAAFGIYNILSSTIIQKINDIAILKATGFEGKDVIQIFIMEAVIMGLIGTILGIIFGSLLIGIMAKIYMGGPVGYFPISFEAYLFGKSALLGVIITICSGYFPARRAANVDPVEIFRK